MPLNTFTVACSTAPTAIGTFLAHYTTSRRKRTHHPAKRQLSYHEGVNLIRQFLVHASHHRVEDLQAFTSGHIPSPQWVRLTITTIPPPSLEKATALLKMYFGPEGLSQIGGEKWWTWRATPLKGEWIEMKSHYHTRRKNPDCVPKRTLLYVHGGAYFFNSVATERYQIQRHARKLNCRAFAPRYRLAPQYPFPCAVLDVLAAYIYLLDECGIPADEILISGDSAGGGLVLGLLCLLRDVGVALPAGGMLISPWVDLLHSFPSIVEEGGGDYIPNYGFHHRPSLAWPPPTVEDLEMLRASIRRSQTNIPDVKTLAEETRDEAVAVEVVKEGVRKEATQATQTAETPRVEIDGKMLEVKEQIQMIAPNEVLDNPLLSPVTQASLGGLCPLLIIAGGGELLRDEIMYVAHKVAQPSKYPTSEIHLDKYPKQKENVDKYPGTKVFLQVFDDCAHVTPTLSFTRPAKYMYRSIANFGIACTSNTPSLNNRPPTASTFATISEPSTPTSPISPITEAQPSTNLLPKVLMTGHIPPFDPTTNMIRHRISTHGHIRPMEPPHTIPALTLPSSEIGVIHAGPTKRWLQAKAKWDVKYAKQKRRVQIQRGKEYVKAQKGGFLGGDLAGERPPPSALAGRPSVRVAVEEGDVGSGKRKNFAGWVWGRLGGKEDKEEEAEEG